MRTLLRIMFIVYFGLKYNKYYLLISRAAAFRMLLLPSYLCLGIYMSLMNINWEQTYNTFNALITHTDMSEQIYT